MIPSLLELTWGVTYKGLDFSILRQQILLILVYNLHFVDHSSSFSLAQMP